MEDLKQGEKSFERKNNKGDATAEIKARLDAYLWGGERPGDGRSNAAPFQIGPML